MKLNDSDIIQVHVRDAGPAECLYLAEQCENGQHVGIVRHDKGLQDESASAALRWAQAGLNGGRMIAVFFTRAEGGIVLASIAPYNGGATIPGGDGRVFHCEDPTCRCRRYYNRPSGAAAVVETLRRLEGR